LWFASSGLGLVMLAAGPVHAQAVQTQTSEAAPNCTQSNVPGCASSVSELVVTGSRLQTTVLNSPNPVIIATSVQLQRMGTDNLERAITQLPGVAPGLTDTNTENFYYLAGLNLVDLRHLGYNRTLVLVDGMRQVAGDVGTNAVDLNTIPVEMVDRVEVVTGGLSAIYGADAVSGVVNIILKDHYQGLDVRVHGGITAYGDGEDWGFSLIGGHNFANDRANVTVGFDFDRSEGVPALARPWGRDSVSVVPNDNPTGPNSPAYITVHNALFFGIDQKGFVAVAPYGANDFYTPNANGTAFLPYNYGTLSNYTVNDVLNNGVQVGGDAGYFRPFDNLSLPLQRFSASLNFTYQLTPKVQFFTENRWAESWVKDRWQPTADFEYGEFFVSASNPYVPASFLPVLAAAGQNGFYFGREYVDEGRRGADDDRFTQQYTVGLKGDLGRFKWQAFVGYGQMNLDSLLVGARDQTRFLQSVDVIELNAAPACADPVARAEGCQPFNPFNPASTPLGAAYSAASGRFTASNELGMTGANITGDLFNLPAGAVSASLGAEARENYFGESGSNCDIQMLCNTPVSGQTKVAEVFSEARVPLLKDFPLVHDLYFQGAVRYSDYTNNGGHLSWNLGGVWSPVQSINFRIMRSRSVRAPNISELYSAETQGFENLNDPCSVLNIPLNPNRAKNCAALGIPAGFAQTTSSKAVYFGGNPNLNVETADTWTAGVTVAPHYVPGLTLTADWYQINLTNAIGALDPQTVLYTCADEAVAPGANPDCAAITRDPSTHQISGVYSNAQNFGRLFTTGWDFNVTYDVPFQQFWSGFPGRLEFNVLASYLQRLRSYDSASDPSTQHQYEGYLGLPKWKFVGSATYALDKVAVTWRLTYLESTSILGSQLVAAPTPLNIYDLQTTGSKIYNDLSIAYQFRPDTNLRLNVNNIFNVAPPDRTNDINEGISYGSAYAAAGIYPNLGTTFLVTVDHKFF
ncbi:MAG: TonB-dependent receptor domain-containing protein, partial [Caulobacteraceae bacterium]